MYYLYQAIFADHDVTSTSVTVVYACYDCHKIPNLVSFILDATKNRIFSIYLIFTRTECIGCYNASVVVFSSYISLSSLHYCDNSILA